MKVQGVHAAGVMQRPHDDMPPCWTLYVTVNDVRALVDNNDLNLLVPITDTPVGPFCGILDSQGAYIQAIQYADGASESGLGDSTNAFRTHGLFSWFELRTQDPEAAAAYYSNLFGWTIEEVQIPMGPYRIVKIGDVGFGAIVGLPADQILPHWCGYVTVDDVDAVVEKTLLLGGTVLFPPMDIPHVGRMTQILDPDGSGVVVITYVPRWSSCSAPQQVGSGALPAPEGAKGRCGRLRLRLSGSPRVRQQLCHSGSPQRAAQPSGVAGMYHLRT